MNFLKTPLSPQTLSALFLVAGTCIGGGMLALPVATSQTGFVPSLCIMACAWACMTCTALYLVEVGFWMKKEEAHVISMSSAMLNMPGKIISWIIYLFIGYASLIAYTAGSGHLLAKAINTFFHLDIPKEWGCFLFVALFGPLFYLKHTTLGKCNAYLFLAMVIAYVFLIAISIPEIKIELLERSDWRYSFTCLPLLLTAFSFQTMVPSLHPYLEHDKRSLKVAVVGGTSLAFLVYIIWQMVVLGTVPFEGPHGLGQALALGEPATHFLGAQVGNHWIEILATFFAFFALVTSFIGIGIGLYDFLSDGLNISKKGWGSFSLVALILFPVLIGSCQLERIFLIALDTSGGFGDAILNGMMPIAMVWIGRYIKKLPDAAFIKGGKKVLVTIFFFCMLVFGIELYVRLADIPEVIALKEVVEL